jgi:hypothetical protein
VPSPYPAARVAVDAETWHAFRQLALRRGISVSTYIGQLIGREVKRQRPEAVERIDVEAPMGDQALEALAAVRANIDELTDIAGRLARIAMDGGSSWERVGKRLRMTARDARAAFERP